MQTSRDFLMCIPIVLPESMLRPQSLWMAQACRIPARTHAVCRERKTHFIAKRKNPFFRTMSMPSVRSLKECGYHRTPHVEASRKRSESTQPREEAGQEVERKYLVLTTLLSKLLEVTAGGALDGLRNHGPGSDKVSQRKEHWGETASTLMVLASSSKPSFLSVRNS